MRKIGNIKAIVFDMDGLLIDSEGLYRKVEWEMFHPLGVSNLSYFDKFMGMRTEEAFIQIKEELKLKQTVEELKKQSLIMMEEAFEKYLQLMPYAYETLEKFFNSYKFALCSSSHRKLINIALQKFNLEKFFQIIISGDDVEKGKPEPEIFLKAAEDLKISPQKILVLEDSPGGVVAAKRAGMYCFAVPNKYTISCDFSMADGILKNLSQLELPK